MSANTSHAVMAQRHEPADSLDFFPTPPWATRALIEHVLIGHGWARAELAAQRVWEPACGTGDMARPLKESFAAVYSTDVHDYSMAWPNAGSAAGGAFGQAAVKDFLDRGRWSPHARAHPYDWVITNPPFRLARPFALRAIGHARAGAALLVRTVFLEGAERYRAMFRDAATRPAIVAPFAERVPMVKGRLDPKASSATSYCWMVWRCDGRRSELDAKVVFIPPCRKRLEREGDYGGGGALADPLPGSSPGPGQGDLLG